MSYILDALRRAQAERGRGSVPGLHTPATPVTGLPVADAGPARGAAWALAALLLAVGLAGAGWWLWRTPAAPAASVAAMAQAPASPHVSTPISAPVVAAAAMDAAPAPVPAAASPPALPRQERAAPRTPAPPPARAERRAAEKPAAAPRSEPAKTPPPASETAAPVFAQADLPPAVREQLPTLQLAGVTYSSNPQYRMAIVNDQVLHEGDQAAPGLVLERIEPGRTVWAFRGYRYALPSR
ncbi:general secretion pathway protein GspB [Alicycliphilus denitrificans]|uniref:general secretion pathway protein GspB n=1 Tax=Alicycliphilus denitrificans TaxID=179636 RepID=UPI003850CA6E